MGTLGNPKIWVQPYINPKLDCSQGICSLACPQWCYLIFPPPPPPFTFSDDNSSSSSSGPTLSPLAITIIGVLASAFLLVSYYAILSKYCGNSEASSSIENQLGNSDGDEVERDEDNNLNEHEPWVVRTTGLDEALIKSITLLKYKKGDGLVASGDCSVCLGEFQEDESLRLLPKCSHAFHVECIDTWLRSHSTCPLCRATIFSTATSRPPLQPPPPLVVDENSNHRNRHHHPPHQDQESSSIQSQEENRIGDHQEEASGRNLPKSPFRALSDLGLHVGEEGHVIRRSISMDHFHETRLSIFDISRMDHKEGSKEAAAGESSKSGSGGGGETSRSGLFHSVVNSVSLKRSFSSGRFLFTKHGRGRNAVIPL